MSQTTNKTLNERINALLNSKCNGDTDASWYLNVMLRLDYFDSLDESIDNIEENMHCNISYGINILEDDDFIITGGTTIFYIPRDIFNYKCVNVTAEKVIQAMESSANAVPEWFESDWIYTREMRNGRYMSRKWNEQELENEAMGLPF